MRKLGVVVAAFVLAATLAQGAPAAARDIEWCDEDPLFAFPSAGVQFKLTTFVHTAAANVSGISYVIDVPANAGPANVSYPGGSRIATTVQIRYTLSSDDGFHAKAAVVASGPNDTDVVIQVSGGSVETKTSTGTTNKTVKLEFSANSR